MYTFSCHMHMHTCSSRSGGGRVRGGCGATGAAGASPAGGGSRGVGPRPNSPSVEQQTQGKPRCMPYYFKL